MKAAKATSLTLPPRLMREVERVAKREGRTRNEVVRAAVQRYIADSRWHQLHEYGRRQARKLGLREGDVQRLIEEVRSED